MKNQFHLIDARETVLQSVTKDTVSLLLLLFGFYINHAYFGNAIVLQIVLGVLFFCCISKLAIERIKKVNNKKEAIEYIEKFFDEEGNK